MRGAVLLCLIIHSMMIGREETRDGSSVLPFIIPKLPFLAVGCFLVFFGRTMVGGGG